MTKNGNGKENGEGRGKRYRFCDGYACCLYAAAAAAAAAAQLSLLVGQESLLGAAQSREKQKRMAVRLGTQRLTVHEDS